MLRGNQGDQTAEIQILELNSLAARQAEMALLSGFQLWVYGAPRVYRQLFGTPLMFP